MPAHLHDPATRELLAYALASELADVTPAELLAAIERVVVNLLPAPARVVGDLAGGADPAEMVDRIREAEDIFRENAEWEHLVDLHVARIGACRDPEERAAILLELAYLFEHEMGDLERALAARLGSFNEAPSAAAVAELERLAAHTGRWQELALRLDEVSTRTLEPATAAAVALSLAAVCRDHADDPGGELLALERGAVAAPGDRRLLDALIALHRAADRPLDVVEAQTRLVDVVTDDDERAALYREMAAGWERIERYDRAAECHERVLTFTAACDDDAYAHLVRLYRASESWRALADTMARRAFVLEADERATLLCQSAAICDRELGDDLGAIDFYQAADDAAPDRADVLSALARLYRRRGADEDALTVLERLAAVLPAGPERARVLVSAADTAWRQLRDGDTAHDLLVRARACDAAHVPAIDALAELHRERGELAAAIELYEECAGRALTADQRARMLLDAGELAMTMCDVERARALLVRAHEADPTDLRGAAALAELDWQAARYHDLVPLLTDLCRRITHPDRLRAQLLRLGHAAAAIGDDPAARAALTRAVALEPERNDTRRALGELLFTQGAWREASEALTRVLDDEEHTLPREVCVELHYRVGHAAHALGDAARARLHIQTALALDPAHRPSLQVHVELDADDPAALIADKLALANAAPAEERGSLLAAIGDVYAEVGDNVAAREIYREALLYRPTDHLLLSRCLGVTAEAGDWRHSLELVQRLIDTEADAGVRARYRHVAAMICRDELDSVDEAAALLHAAVADAPDLVHIADELEALLSEADRAHELAQFYYARLDQMRAHEARAGERLRLWDRLAELCVSLDMHADAACAYEVAIELEPDRVSRRQRVADLYLEPGLDQRDKAIGQHQEILRRSKRRLASYDALRALYSETGQFEKADACADALAIIGVRPVANRARVATARPMLLADDAPVLRADDYTRLGMGDVDRLLSALFCRVAPAFATERAQPRLPGRSALRASDPRPAARACRHVTTVLGVIAPATHVKREQTAPCLVSLRRDGEHLAPVLTLSRAALDAGEDERALVFELGRRLVDLRSERFARLLCPRAEDLGQVVELAMAMATTGDPSSVAEVSNTARWLAQVLRPVDLDQLAVIGERLAEREADPAHAALGWLEATERVADRVGYLLAGDLATCVRVLERGPTARSTADARILDLVWASVTEPMFEVRARLEDWAGVVTADRNHDHVA